MLNWLLLAFVFFMIVFAIYILKRGRKKLKYIKQNKKLVKDQDWKDIHMKIPEYIIIMTIG